MSHWVIFLDFLILIFFIWMMGTVTEVSVVPLSELNEIMHAKSLEENHQKAGPQISYSGLCTSDLVGWFLIIVNIKPPVFRPSPFFLLPVSKDGNKLCTEAQLGMHSSCLILILPVTGQRRLWVRSEDRAPIDLNYCPEIESSVRHLNLMLPFPWGSVPHCCILLYPWLARHHVHCPLHQDDGIVLVCMWIHALVFQHSYPSLFIFSASTPGQELCCVLASKELISTYEQGDNFSKPQQDQCRLCPKDENIFWSELLPSLFGCN